MEPQGAAAPRPESVGIRPQASFTGLSSGHQVRPLRGCCVLGPVGLWVPGLSHTEAADQLFAQDGGEPGVVRQPPEEKWKPCVHQTWERKSAPAAVTLTSELLLPGCLARSSGPKMQLLRANWASRPTADETLKLLPRFRSAPTLLLIAGGPPPQNALWRSCLPGSTAPPSGMCPLSSSGWQLPAVRWWSCCR